MDEKEIAHLRRWDAIHGLDTLNWDPARRITNWDSIRNALHKALNEVERLRAENADLERSYANADYEARMGLGSF